MANLWIEAIGLIAGVLGIIAWFPQLKKIWIEKSSEGISLSAFSLILAALSLWFFYGYMINSPALMISNGATWVMICFVIIGTWKNSSKKV
tara:strand:+ start:390 stop:662 length:273 start_codon:yes stop_codon:yes gene_type:complete